MIYKGPKEKSRKLALKSEKYKERKQANKIERMKSPACFLKEGRETEGEGKRSSAAHFWGHYRREWLPFVPP